MKFNKIIIIFLIILISILLFIFLLYKIYKLKNIEKFEQPNYNILISKLNNTSGFFSGLFFKLNHYLYCKKYNIDFKMIESNWPYKFKDGWTDYFEDIILTYEKNINNQNTHYEPGCHKILEEFPLIDYKNIIPEFYKNKYNTKTKEHIQNIKQKLGLIDKEYGAIYIRRGDKLIDETKFIPSSKFVDLLLEKYPDCKIIFVQTDDYNSYLEAKKYVNEILKKDNIAIITLCPENIFGAIANSKYLNKIKNNNIDNANKEYVQQIKNISKPISDMNPQERYDHTMELITSVDICINSNVTICDYDSNVSRFIKLAHSDFTKVFDVKNTDSGINLEDKKCPAYKFI
jgi:hypothetical protein